VQKKCDRMDESLSGHFIRLWHCGQCSCSEVYLLMS